MERKINGRDIR